MTKSKIRNRNDSRQNFILVDESVAFMFNRFCDLFKDMLSSYQNECAHRHDLSRCPDDCAIIDNQTGLIIHTSDIMKRKQS